VQAVASNTFCVQLQLYHTVKSNLLFQQTILLLIWLLQLHNCPSLANSRNAVEQSVVVNINT